MNDIITMLKTWILIDTGSTFNSFCNRHILADNNRQHFDSHEWGRKLFNGFESEHITRGNNGGLVIDSGCTQSILGKNFYIFKVYGESRVTSPLKGNVHDVAYVVPIVPFEWTCHSRFAIYLRDIKVLSSNRLRTTRINYLSPVISPNYAPWLKVHWVIWYV